MADCLNNEQQINSNLSESNVDALTSNLDGASSVTSEMSGESSISSTMSSTDATTSNLGSEEPLKSELDLPTTYTYKGSETDNIVVTVDNKGFIISASVKQIKFNSASNFPEVGSEHLIYIDATNKALYGWDANSGYYKLVADVKVPTKLSEFKNDGDGINPFITKVVSDLQNYYTKSETYTQDEIRNLVSAIPKFSIKVVTELPTTDISETTIYLVTNGSDNQDLYIEYIYVNNAWEKLGKQRIDLSNYPTKEELAEAITSALVDYYTSAQVDGIISTIKSEVPKLYDETGQNTDGAMTQKAVTDELNRLGIMYKGVCETDFVNDAPTYGSLTIDNFPYTSMSECPIGTKFEISFTHPSTEITVALTLTINNIEGIKVGITSRDSVDYSFDTYELSWIANDTIDFEWNGTYLIAKSVSGRIINPDVVTSEFSDTVRTQSTKGSIFFPLLSYGSPQNTSNIDDSRTTPYETEILHKGITGETVFNSYNDLPLKINHKSRAFGIGTGTLEDGTTTTGLLLYDDISTKLSDEHKILLLPRKNGVIATLDDVSSGGAKIIWEVWE